MIETANPRNGGQKGHRMPNRPAPIDHPQPGLRRILAPNPSPMTLHGTNTYMVGTGDVAVIDPGPDDAGHLATLLSALSTGERISHIFVTHSHLDHSALAHKLAAATGAPILGYGDAFAGRSDQMMQLSKQGHLAGGEGVDMDFRPDILLKDGQKTAHSDWSLEAIHTPGHMANHLSFAFEGYLLSGDHVMGWSTSLISPPDGDMAAFMSSIERLLARSWQRFFPGHGDAIEVPSQRMHTLRDHRQAREAAILRLLGQKPATPAEITRHLYQDVPVALLAAAERNVLAHLIKLHNQQQVTADPRLSPNALFRLA
ncbi:MAG: glyoxylase-like metal-dependent hydrolase (beta-lactamase superfamily II) [Pseudorhodobacter sp.]|jgi:glyoxylase-like metal-dependent hydrolase (beta-lactamase superfamily II)